MVAVVILRGVLHVVRMSKWRKQVIKCKKFYHFAMGEGVTSFTKGNSANLFLVKNGKMKLSGESIFSEYAKKLKVKSRSRRRPLP